MHIYTEITYFVCPIYIIQVSEKRSVVVLASFYSVMVVMVFSTSIERDELCGVEREVVTACARTRTRVYKFITR
jgi:hypothetical protein